MHELLPIIRRVRRPLIAVDASTLGVGCVEPVRIEDASRTRIQTTDDGRQTTGGSPVPPKAENDAPTASIPTE